MKRKLTPESINFLNDALTDAVISVASIVSNKADGTPIDAIFVVKGIGPIKLFQRIQQEAEDLQFCRVCGCHDDDCSECIEKTGQPCYWVEEDLCSACAAKPVPKPKRAKKQSARTAFKRCI